MWYSKTKEEIGQTLDTNFITGLSETQAKERLKKYGFNQLPTIKNRPWYVIFIIGFFEPLSIVLWFAAFLMITIEGAFGASISYIDFSVLIGIVIINSSIQTFEQLKARKSLESLKKLTLPTVTVKRDNKMLNISANNLVVGDIVFLEVGKYIPADIRILDAQQLKINESALTGESLPVLKKTEVIDVDKTILGEQLNMAFMSTFITSGHFEGVVVATGKDTEIGKISTSIATAKNIRTPLQKQLAKITKLIAIMATFVSIFVFLFLFFTNPVLWPTYIILAILVSIALIPESLMVLISIILSLAVQKMNKINVIVKKMDAIETLGSLNVICSDKTGTLTKNKMSVQALIYNEKEHNESDNMLLDLNKLQDFHFINSLSLCNDAINEHANKIGDPTEIALIDYTRKYIKSELQWRIKYPRINEKAFESERKLMSTINIINNQKILYVKGAIEELLKECHKTIVNNEIKIMTDENKKIILNYQSNLSKNGLRVLGFAYKFENIENEINENDLIFIGAVGMIDPPRDEVMESVQKAKNAGIDVMMITGDHQETALAIAQKLDIAQNIEQVMEGVMIDKLSEQELSAKMTNIRVFARVNPEHKTKIVKCLQKMDKIVAMTGDGVNDAPSLVNADVGIAMGITGTDVAKEAAKIILHDDNFATIINGIEEGRNVFQKIKQTIVFVFASNIAEVLTFIIIAFFTRLMGVNIEPLGSLNILYFNLIIESCLGVGMALKRGDKNIMFNQPYKKNIAFFKNAWGTMIFLITLTTTSVILTYLIGVYGFAGGDLYNGNARVATIFVMISAPLFYAYFIKLPSPWVNPKIIKKKHHELNYYLIGIIIFIMCLNIILVYVSSINNVFIDINDSNNNKIATPLLSWQMSLIAIVMMLIPGISLIIFNYINDNLKYKHMKVR